mgnify:CR=1 FL=1
MKIVIDTNILLSFFWKDSITRKLIINLKNSLLAPEKAREEIIKYSNEIIQKLKISRKDFEKLFEELEEYIDFIEKKEYSDFIEKVEKIAPDKDDCDFLALAYKNEYTLWSNDKLLKNQEIVKIISTKELLED